MDEISETYIEFEGKIIISPPNKTKKHEKQKNWKRVGMIIFPGSDICEFYSHLLYKKYDIKLNKPLRDSHLTFVNDDFLRDSILPNDEKEIAWSNFEKKYNNQKIKVILDISRYYTNGTHYWLIIPHEHRNNINEMRREIGLSKYFFGLHLTLGTINENNKIQSDYIIELSKKGFSDIIFI